jgi:hypothetical protein
MTAFIVIGGGGCTARDYFTSAELAEHPDPCRPDPHCDPGSVHQARKQPAALIVLAFTLSVFA